MRTPLPYIDIHHFIQRHQQHRRELRRTLTNVEHKMRTPWTQMNDKEQMAEVQILSPRLSNKARSNAVKPLLALLYAIGPLFFNISREKEEVKGLESCTRSMDGKQTEK